MILSMESSSGFLGVVFVTMMFSSLEFRMLSNAFPENNPWVAKLLTLSAP